MRKGKPLGPFCVISRDDYECQHDTGVGHSMGMDCEEAELLAYLSHMHPKDPLHDATWHSGDEEDLGHGLTMRAAKGLNC